MPWVRLDDRFPTHRKVALLSDRAFRLYVSGLCWASENLTEGVVLDRELTLLARVRNTKAAAKELEAAGLWDRIHDGWQIHDFLDYNPDRAKVKADREANAARQKAFRDRQKAARDAKKAAAAAAETEDRNGVTNGVTNAGVTTPPSPSPSPSTYVEKDKSAPAPREADTASSRDDVERICTHLADRIEGNGSKRPRITKAWRDAARLLIDSDERTEDQVHIAIDWCQDNDFWRSNILSMPKLREKYEQLRLQATRKPLRIAPQTAPRHMTDEEMTNALQFG